MNKDRFLFLLDAHLENRASEEEIDELVFMIRSGNYDDLLKKQIDRQLDTVISIADMLPERAIKMRNHILGHDKEASIHPKPRTFSPWWTAAALVIIAVTGYFFSMHKSKPDEDSYAQYEEMNEPIRYKGKQFVRLPDGSSVILNENSLLSFSQDFGTKERVVHLSGEGYFDIRKDENKPFKVYSGDLITTVVGTAFNIQAFSGQGKIIVSVTRGKVKVSPAPTSGSIPSEVVLTAHEEVAFNTKTLLLKKITQPENKAIAWKQDYLIFDDVSFKEAAKTIEDRYTVKLLFKNPKLQNCRFTATFLDKESLEQVLTVITSTLNASYITSGNLVTIDGSACTPSYEPNE